MQYRTGAVNGPREVNMSTVLLLQILLLLLPQTQTTPTKDASPAKDPASIMVLSIKWTRVRETVKAKEQAGIIPAREMIPDNKNYPRNSRVNLPAGARDPNEDTIDGRSAAIEKMVQESRTPPPKNIDNFLYSAKVLNGSKRSTDVIFWEYQFLDPTNQTVVARHQVLCGVNIKPDKDKELIVLSMSGPADVVSVNTLAGNSGNHFLERVLINRVEYSDGSIWQRKDWKYSEVQTSLKRVLSTPWTEMCRAL
jgi:hypothetical protein